MADFKSALNLGISAAGQAEKNRNEITTVFQQLNSQVGEATQGRIQIKRQEVSKLKNKYDDVIYGDRYRYRVISAINRSANARETLAKWGQSGSGYPCTIVLDETEIHCENKEALERGLSTLLQDKVIAELIKKLMLTEPKQPTNIMDDDIFEEQEE